MGKELDADCCSGKEGRRIAAHPWRRRDTGSARARRRSSLGRRAPITWLIAGSQESPRERARALRADGRFRIARPLGGPMTLRRHAARFCWQFPRVVRSPLVLPLLFFALAPPRSVSAQQTGTITGVVRAQETGAPLRDARVTIAGTRFNTRTDSAGQYTIPDVPPGTYHVQAQIIGYELGQVRGVVVTADQSATADFQLTQLAIALQELVVVGYGTQVRRDVTGSLASVDGDNVHEVPKVNAIEAIKGRVAGVDIVTTGNKPGDGVRVRLRGERSLKASNDPLYVLNGIPMAGGIGDLKPRGIESIDVVHDASAAAIYGSLGANGPVLLTTRQGPARATKVPNDTDTRYQAPPLPVRLFNGPEF